MVKRTTKIKVPLPSPVPRFGVQPTRREVERTKRKPKHPPKDHE